MSADARNGQIDDKTPQGGIKIRVAATRRRDADKLRRHCSLLAWRSKQAWGTGECRWTPKRVGQDKIHREMRTKIHVKTTRRRSDDKLLLIAAALAWRSRRPVTGRVNVA